MFEQDVLFMPKTRESNSFQKASQRTCVLIANLLLSEDKT